MIELLFVGGIALLLIAAVLAPAEALGWWARSYFWASVGPSMRKELIIWSVSTRIGLNSKTAPAILYAIPLPKI